MSFEEEFDKIMRQKADGAEFPLEQANLDKLGMLLDARNAATAVAWWKKMMVPAAAVLLISSAALFVYNSNSNEKTTASKNATSSKSIIPNSEKELNAEISSKNVAQIKSPGTEQAAFVEDKKESLLKEPVSHAATAVASLPQKLKETTTQANSSKAEESLSSPLPDNEVVQQDLASASSGSDDSKTEDQATTDKGALSKINLSKPSIQNEKPEETETVVPLTVTLEKEEMEIVRTTWLPSVSAKLAELGEPELSLKGLIVLKRYEEDYYIPTQIKNYLALQGGAHYGLGWNVGNTKDGLGLNYFGGLEFGHVLSEKFNMSVGLQYYQFSNIYQPYYSSLVKGYGFGYTDSYSSVTTDLLQYAAIPVKFGYRLNKSLTAGIGVNAAYLLAGHSRVDNYGVSDGVKGPVTSVGVSNIYEGSNSINVMGSVFLQTQIQKRVSVFAEFQYGLTDLFVNSPKNKIEQKSTGLRLGLNINLFEN